MQHITKETSVCVDIMKYVEFVFTCIHKCLRKEVLRLEN